MRKYKQKKTKTIFAILTIISLLVFLGVIFFTNPNDWQQLYLLPFFISLTTFLIFIQLIFISKTIITIITSLSIDLILILRILSFKDWYYPIIIIGLASTLIYLFTLTEDNDIIQNNNLINQSNKFNDK